MSVLLPRPRAFEELTTLRVLATALLVAQYSARPSAAMTPAELAAG